MLPKIWIFDSYTLMIIIGLLFCFGYLIIYNKKRKIFSRDEVLAILINACFSIVSGLVFAVLFQNLYNLIELGKDYKFSLSMTFYGGLIGGVITFLCIYFFIQRKQYGSFLLDRLLPIASSMICIAHGFGRIGCFFSGCCYGVETDSFIGIKFVSTSGKVIPTNLFEAIFLIALSIVLLILVFNNKGKYNFPLYMISYGIWRFIIEFFRGDDRGKFIFNIPPSQFWSILFIIGGVILLYIYRKGIKENVREKRS